MSVNNNTIKTKEKQYLHLTKEKRRKFSFGSPFFLKNGIKFVYSIIYLMFLCSFEGGIENENMETYE